MATDHSSTPTSRAGREFAIERERDMPGTPADYWEAVTTGNAGWLWPTPPPEPRVGGEVAGGGTVLAWEPERHLIMRHEGPDGWFNQLEHIIEARDGGTTWIRYVHSGVFTDDWDTQYDGVSQHTDFYLHTLSQYLGYFTGRPAVWVNVDAPASSKDGGFERLVTVMGLAGSRVHDTVVTPLPGVTDAVLDYRAPHFLGLRTHDALYRVFGRDAFGAPVAVVAHLFSASADEKTVEAALRTWLDGIFA